MIDLTPLDVRKKRGDFGKGLRGYDPQEVDVFLEMVSERMEVLVKENLAFREKIERLGEKVVVQEGREQAIQDALVTAQELLQDVKKQASREAKLIEREAQGRIDRMITESEKLVMEHSSAVQKLERRRDRFLKSLRTFLERELDTVEVELGRAPLEDATFDLELGQATWSIGEEDWDDDADQRNQQDEHEPEARAPKEAGEGEDVSAAESADTAQVAAAADDPPTAGDPVASGPVGPEEEYGETKADDERPPEGQEGEDSLWLSSIMIDQEDEDPERQQ